MKKLLNIFYIGVLVLALYDIVKWILAGNPDPNVIPNFSILTKTLSVFFFIWIAFSIVLLVLAIKNKYKIKEHKYFLIYYLSKFALLTIIIPVILVVIASSFSEAFRNINSLFFVDRFFNCISIIFASFVLYKINKK